MKLPISLVVALFAPCVACTVRSADVYARDTGAVLATRNDAIRACYDGVLKATPEAKGTVTVKFDVETEGGGIAHVAVDPTGTTAPAPVADCVTHNLTGLAIAPPDSKEGKGTWVYDFAATGVSGAAPAATASTAPKS